MLQIPNLDALGDIDAEKYRHVAKLVESSDDLSLPTAYLKWYDIRREDLVVDPDVRLRARDFIAVEAEVGGLVLDNELGFVIFHRSGDGYFLIVCTWRNANEMHQTMWYADANGFALVPRNTPHIPTQCVWELGVTSHERRAWSTFLFSARDNDAKVRYIQDRCHGQV
jgi:hypothetical protein